MATGGWGSTLSNPFSSTSVSASNQYQDVDLESNGNDTRPLPVSAAPWPGALAGPGGMEVDSQKVTTGQKVKKGAAAVGTSLRGTFTKSKDAVASGMSNIDIGRAPGSREDQLAAKEAELRAREEDLRRREAALSGAVGVRQKNWPFKCMPIAYHSIVDDIPPWNRRFMRIAYALWLLSAGAFIYNWIIMLAMLFSGVYSGAGLRWFFIATLVSALGLPGSWWLWYQGLYSSTQSDGAFIRYSRAFVWLGLHIFWCIWMTLALPFVGEFSAGIFTMFSLFSMNDSKGYVFGVMSIFNVVAWGLASLGCIVLLGRAIALFRAADLPRKRWEEASGGPWSKA